MNSRTRKEISRRYIRLTDEWAARYEKAVAVTIRKQIQGVINKLQEGDVLYSTESRIDAARRFNELPVFDSVLTKVLSNLFRGFAIEYATSTYNRLIRASRRKIKADGTGAFGFSEEWNQAVTDYLNQFILVRAVLPVTEGTKKQILRILLQGQAEGWGIDRIIKELQNEEVNELTVFRARRIVRTELSISANFADKMVQDSVPFEVEKTWISVKDNRRRHSHEMMDGVTVDGDADFHVPIIRKRVQIGIDLMSGPGDPEATAGNVINCRCTRALVPKRDKNKRLIPKPQKIRP